MVATVALEGSCPEEMGSGASRPVIDGVCTPPELQGELVSATSAMRETFQGCLRSVGRVADWGLPNSSRALIVGTRCCTRVLHRWALTRAVTHHLPSRRLPSSLSCGQMGTVEQIKRLNFSSSIPSARRYHNPTP